MLIRLHPRARKTLFVPNGTKDRPIPVEDLANQRTTEMEFEDGTKRTFTDNWRSSKDPCAKVDSFKGRTIVLLKSKPTGQGVFGKTSTLPKRLSESKEARRPGIDPLLSIDSRVDSSSRPSRPLSVEDTFTSRLDKAIEGTLDDFKALVLHTSMIDGWTFLPLMFVCTMRSIRLCMCHLTTVRVLLCRTLRRHV